MKTTTLLISICLFVGLTSLKAQDTIPSCVWGVSNSGNTMLTEYADGDSTFITLWSPNGSLIRASEFSGYYYVSNDTVTMIQDPGQPPCGNADTGIYIFTLDDTSSWRHSLTVTLVNDNCQDRVTWYSSFNMKPCYAKYKPLFNTCWVSMPKVTGDYFVMELTDKDSVFVTGYDSNGVIDPAVIRKPNGMYYSHLDTVIFINSAGCPDPGVYTFSYYNNQLHFTLVNDACTYRVNNTTSLYNWPNCADVNIGTEDYSLAAQEIKVYPNPASKSLTLENLRSHFNDKTLIVLYDLVGNKVVEQKVDKPSNSYTINVDHLNTGVYFLQVIQDNREIVTERVIVENN